MAGDALARVFAPGARFRFGIPSSRGVDGDDEHRTTGRLGAADDPFSDCPARGRVELLPDRAAGRSRDVLDAHGRDGGEELKRLARGGGTGGGQFAIRVESLLAAAGQRKMGVDHFAPRRSTVVSTRENIDQAAGPEMDAGVGFVVLAHGAVVIHASRQITEVRWRDGFPRGRFEVENI